MYELGNRINIAISLMWTLMLRMSSSKACSFGLWILFSFGFDEILTCQTLPSDYVSNILEVEVGRKWPPPKKSGKFSNSSNLDRGEIRKPHFRLYQLQCTTLVLVSQLLLSLCCCGRSPAVCMCI